MTELNETPQNCDLEGLRMPLTLMDARYRVWNGSVWTVTRARIILQCWMHECGMWLRVSLSTLYFLSGDNNSKWVKHWVKGGYYYYHNLETQEGGWEEPPDFVQNSMQLSREEIQVGPISSQREKAERTCSRANTSEEDRACA